MKSAGACSCLLPAALVLILSCAAVARGQDFPCPPLDDSGDASNAAAPVAAGGYENFDLGTLDGEGVTDVVLAANASLAQWIETAGNFTICDDFDLLGRDVSLGFIQTCRQIVAGTNYGLKFIAQYNCFVDADTAGENGVVLYAVVYLPPGDALPEVQFVRQDTDVPVQQVQIDEVSADSPLPPLPAPEAPQTAPGANVAGQPYTLEGL